MAPPDSNITHNYLNIKNKQKFLKTEINNFYFIQDLTDTFNFVVNLLLN